MDLPSCQNVKTLKPFVISLADESGKPEGQALVVVLKVLGCCLVAGTLGYRVGPDFPHEVGKEPDIGLETSAGAGDVAFWFEV